MLFIAFLVAVLFIIIALFSFPKFSPIPYFPTNKKDLKLIVKALDLKSNQVVYDLGAGDGVVIFEAAKEALKRKLNTRFIAVEINPVLLCILYTRWLFHPNRSNIKIAYGNMFNMNFNELLTFNFSFFTFYMYISPWHLEKTANNIKRQLRHFNVVSYMYSIRSLQSKEIIIEGKNKIFMYQVF